MANPENHDEESSVAAPPSSHILKSFDLEGIAKYIERERVQRVIVMCGDGVSANAGVPHLRTTNVELHEKLQRLDVPDAKSIFDVDYFKQRPDAFYELCRDMWSGTYDPTPSHYFIRLLSEKGLLQRCYTENIDFLERRAGVDDDQLVAAYGDFESAHVIDDVLGLDHTYDVSISELKAALDKGGSEGWQQLREHYGGLVKPKICFFGEELPENFMTLYRMDLESCDLLLVLGTSLQIAPFNRLLSIVPSSVPRLLINQEPTGLSEDLHSGFCFHHPESNLRDVFYASECDSGVRALVDKLGWTSDLDALIESRGTAEVSSAPWAPERSDLAPEHC